MSTWVTDEDQEDYEQEQRIQSWLKSQGATDEFDFKHISRKGTARNTLVRAALSLDQQISDDSTGTFADLIAGSDGRDLYGGEDLNPIAIIDAYLCLLGMDEELSEWVLKMLKSSISQSRLLLETSLTDLEW